MEYTHQILSYKGQKIEILARVGDGILIGQRKGFTVVYGEAPNKKDSRVFIDEEHASRYLRGHVALEDLKLRDLAGPVKILDIEGSPIIELPDGTDVESFSRPNLVKFGAN